MNLTRLLSLTPLLLLAACSTYLSDYDYRPSPAIGVTGEGADESTVYATVRGVLRGGSEGDPPHGIDMQMRIEAPDSGDFRISGENLRLLTADLVELPLLRMEPDGPIAVAAGHQGTWRLIFGFRDGEDSDDVDLDGLAFAWNATVGGRRARGNLEFERIRYYRSGPTWHIGVGHHYGHSSYHFGYAHHHWGHHGGWWVW